MLIMYLSRLMYQYISFTYLHILSDMSTVYISEMEYRQMAIGIMVYFQDIGIKISNPNEVAANPTDEGISATLDKYITSRGKTSAKLSTS